SQLVDHLLVVVARREHLKGNRDGDVVLFPLAIGAAVALRSAKDDKDVGSDANLGEALNGIPQQISSDEHLLNSAEQCREVAEEDDDPPCLFGVVGQGLAIAFGVEGRPTQGRRDQVHLLAPSHNRSPRDYPSSLPGCKLWSVSRQPRTLLSRYNTLVRPANR